MVQKEPTMRQLQIAALVKLRTAETGLRPTFKELADAAGIAYATLVKHVEAMQRRGLVRRDPHKARSLELTRKGMYALRTTRGREALRAGRS